jgi:hypothetical protein
LPTKFRQTLPHTFQRSFRREPLAGRSSTRKKGLDLPQLLAQLGFDRHRQGSVEFKNPPFDNIDVNLPSIDIHAIHSPWGKRLLSPNGLSSTLTFNRVFSGKASFYSYPKGKTASGSPFNRDALTAAHRSLPFGTRVRVTDLTSSKSVVVRITDRGPRVRGRVLDLSLGAARSLGIEERGVVQVHAEVL